MKKRITVLLLAVLVVISLPGCVTLHASAKPFDPTNPVYVITREEGSGTRDAFVELTDVLEKMENGNRTDHTTIEAAVLSSTQAVMSNIISSPYAIGFISLGSMNDSIKAVKVNGVAPTTETIQDGAYAIARPFHIATKEKVSDAAADFIAFILSEEGQAVVTDTGYVAVGEAKPYNGNGAAGVVKVSGSSSVSPVMEKLTEAYKQVNEQIKVELQTTDSSSGMTAAVEGTCDIGMASRDLKDSELERGLKETQIAMDGITVIISHENPVDSLTVEQIKDIYTGQAKTWDFID